MNYFFFSDKQLQAFINRLPTKINSDADWAPYRQFIAAFGTHYISSCQLGAKINVTSIFESSLVNKYGAAWVTAQAQIGIDVEKIAHLKMEGNLNVTKSKA